MRNEAIAASPGVIEDRPHPRLPAMRSALGHRLPALRNAWFGLVIGMAVATVIGAGVTGVTLSLALPPLVEPAATAAGAALALAVPVGLLRALAAVLARRGQFPGRLAPALRSRAATSVGVAAALVTVLLLLPDEGPAALVQPIAFFEWVILLWGASGALLGVAATLRRSDGHRSRGAAALLSGAVLLANGVLAGWIVLPGDASHVVPWPAPAEVAGVPLLDLEDPGQPGAYAVRALTYGSGTDRHRPEYGTDADMISPTVDVTPALAPFEGLQGDLYRWFWGFELDSVPLNARVWWPDGEGPFPVVLVVHGNHAMGDFSDPGYAYLGEHLASRGFLVASIDENFLNGSVAGDFDGREMDARAWMLLRHLDQLVAWSKDPATPLYGVVDPSRVVLVGHSRGGEAAAMAAWYRETGQVPSGLAEVEPHRILGVVAIAPSDGMNRGSLPRLTETSYLLLSGDHDAQTGALLGIRQYSRTELRAGSDAFKATVWLHRANHNQFSTVWGRWDYRTENAWLTNSAPLLSGEEQRTAAKVLIGAFAEAVLHDEPAYRSVFREPLAALAWLPDDLVVTRYEDGSLRRIVGSRSADRSADATVSSTGFDRAEIVWPQLRDGGAQSNPMLLLRWSQADATYRLALRPGAPRPALDDVLQLQVGSALDDATSQDLVIQLVDADGTAVRRNLGSVRPIPPAVESHHWKADWLAERYGLGSRLVGSIERVVQTFDLALADFAAADPAFDPLAIAEIALIPNSPEGALHVDEIGWASPPAGNP